MPLPINTNYNARFQAFVNFANKAYETSGEDSVARFEGAPKGDYKGTFASIFRSSAMKTANDQVRDVFRKAVADLFGGEKFIPDIVRDNMKLEDFGKGRPLTARRVRLVKIAIDTLAGRPFLPHSAKRPMAPPRCAETPRFHLPDPHGAFPPTDILVHLFAFRAC